MTCEPLVSVRFILLLLDDLTKGKFRAGEMGDSLNWDQRLTERCARHVGRGSSLTASTLAQETVRQRPMGLAEGTG